MYWLVSLPWLDGVNEDRTWQLLQNKVSFESNLAENYKFKLPELRVGTLDSLMVLSDDLVKTNALVEAVVNKLRRQLFDLQTSGAAALGWLCVRACVRACVRRACVRVRVLRACVCVCVCVRVRASHCMPHTRQAHSLTSAKHLAASRPLVRQGRRDGGRHGAGRLREGVQVGPGQVPSQATAAGDRADNHGDGAEAGGRPQGKQRFVLSESASPRMSSHAQHERADTAVLGTMVPIMKAAQRLQLSTGNSRTRPGGRCRRLCRQSQRRCRSWRTT